MLTCKLSELVETIQKGVIPKWLHDYVQRYRENIVRSLESTGQYSIPMPGGGEIIIRQEPSKPIKRKTRPNCF
jgi:hypothetical protein